LGDTLDILSRHLGPAILVICRIGGLAIFAPLFASSTIPHIVKVLMIVMLAVATYPVLAIGPLHGVEVPLDLASIAPLIVGEVLIGALTGFLALFPLVAMQMGGQVMGTQMGLGFARLYNPAMEDEGDVLEQILFFLGFASFLAVGGHEQVMLAVLRSFEYVGFGGAGGVVAIGGYGIDNAIVRLLAGVLLAALEVALRVSAPLVCLFLLESVAIGFLSKSVPAFNLMSLGFPLRIILGLGILVLGIGAIGEALDTFLRADLDIVASWCRIGEGA
jgi:flagellar biosynthesis protein FliR